MRVDDDRAHQGRADRKKGDGDGGSGGGKLGPALLVGSSGAIASVAPVTGVLAFSAAGGDGIGAAFPVALVALGLAVAVPVLLPAVGGVRRSWPARPRLVTAGLLLADIGLMLLLTPLAPFRWGLLSCLLYGLPALLVAAAVVFRSRAVAAATVGGVLAVYAVALPVGALQQRVAAGEWMRATGIPSRALVQVVALPGLDQEPYSWDGKTVTAMFSLDAGPSTMWMGAETVTSGRADPCGRLLEGDGDASGTSAAPCVRRGGNWRWRRR